MKISERDFADIGGYQMNPDPCIKGATSYNTVFVTSLRLPKSAFGGFHKHRKRTLFITHELSEQLNERQAEALGYMRLHGPLTVKEYLEKFGCGEKLARRELQELVQLKLVVAKQAGRTRVYEIVDF